MVTKGVLKMALAAEKGTDFKKLKEKRRHKEIAKRKRAAATSPPKVVHVQTPGRSGNFVAQDGWAPESAGDTEDAEGGPLLDEVGQPVHICRKTGLTYAQGQPRYHERQ